jgi:hypothetical protein
MNLLSQVNATTALPMYTRATGKRKRILKKLWCYLVVVAVYARARGAKSMWELSIPVSNIAMEEFESP